MTRNNLLTFIGRAIDSGKYSPEVMRLLREIDHIARNIDLQASIDDEKRDRARIKRIESIFEK